MAFKNRQRLQVIPNLDNSLWAVIALREELPDRRYHHWQATKIILVDIFPTRKEALEKVIQCEQIRRDLGWN